MIREAIRNKRIKLGISQRALAKKIGIRNATLCDFENGKYGISSKTLDLIFEELEIILS